MVNELYHYGVKGMKWGVRHDKERVVGKKSNNSKLSAKQKERLKLGLAAAGAVLVVAGGVYISKNSKSDLRVADVSYDPLKESLGMFKDDNAVSLQPGTKFQRISDSAVEDTVKRGEAYVSYKLRDNMKYKDRMPKMSWIDTPFIHKITADKSVKAPSSREAASIFLKQNPDSSHAEYIKFMEQGIRDSGSDKRNMFVKELNRRGYNAVVDDNDSGWTKSPLILLNPNELIGKIKSRKLTTAEKVIAVYFK